MQAGRAGTVRKTGRKGRGCAPGACLPLRPVVPLGQVPSLHFQAPPPLPSLVVCTDSIALRSEECSVLRHAGCSRFPGGTGVRWGFVVLGGGWQVWG